MLQQEPGELELGWHSGAPACCSLRVLKTGGIFQVLAVGLLPLRKALSLGEVFSAKQQRLCDVLSRVLLGEVHEKHGPC